ncbi:MAG: hypothetical protein ACK5QX_10220, partial [bacterium]
MTYQEAEDKVAKDNGYPAFANIGMDFYDGNIDYNTFKSFVKDVAELYAKSKWEQGLETRLKEILESHAYTVERYKSERDGLRNRSRFCRDHKFEEEHRITFIKLEQMEMLFYEYEIM